jgi:pimeloyl-ACP methyl ester carboxylesterase
LVISQGGYYALECARLFPQLVKAVVAVEPPAVPGTAKPSVAYSPHLFIWGDYIHNESETWSHYFRVVEDYRQMLGDSGTIAEVIELPTLGIRGNSHMLIMDRNNQLIAKLVQDWLIKQVRA